LIVIGLSLVDTASGIEKAIPKDGQRMLMEGKNK
jgi:hypothetical protein